MKDMRSKWEGEECTMPRRRNIFPTDTLTTTRADARTVGQGCASPCR